MNSGDAGSRTRVLSSSNAASTRLVCKSISERLTLQTGDSFLSYLEFNSVRSGQQIRKVLREVSVSRPPKETATETVELKIKLLEQIRYLQLLF